MDLTGTAVYDEPIGTAIGDTSGGVAFGGGIVYGYPTATGGGGTFAAPTFGGTTTVNPTLTAPVTTTAAPAQTFTLSSGGATGLNHPAAPKAPTAAPTQPVPQQQAPGALTPLSTSQAPGMQQAPGATNPYSASMPSYTPPSSPLAFARIGAEGQGAPTAPQQGIAPVISGGGAEPIQVSGGGPRGGAFSAPASIPPMSANAGLNPLHLEGAIAYNGNPATYQGNGSQNRGTLQAGQQNRGNGLVVPPPPPAPPFFVPPPIAGTPTAAQMAAMQAAGNGQPAPGLQAQQPQTDPNVLTLDASTAGVLKYMQNSLNRSLTNADAFQSWVKDNQKKVDAAAVRFLASQLAGPQKMVDEFEKPGPAGLSRLEMANEMLKDAIDARANQQDIRRGRYKAHFDTQAALYVRDAAAANKLPIPGLKPEANTYVQAQRAAGIDQASRDLSMLYAKAAYDAENARETDALKKSQDIFNDYHKALVDKANAFKAATDVIQTRQDAFWKQVDQARSSETHLNDQIQNALKTWADVERSRSNDDFRNAQLQLSAEANKIAAAKATADIAEKHEQTRQKALEVAQKQRAELDDRKKHKQDDPATKEQKIRLEGRISALEETK